MGEFTPNNLNTFPMNISNITFINVIVKEKFNPKEFATKKMCENMGK